ncbi:MAG: phosphoribosylanthranilate isomerase [Oscillospiraceae bacterium]|jgi:phosphoribosylanthranilate isomerase|nr:phosphoribosylanthranilate isomerase [Oscillospiraceae bacterium]
MRIKICGLSRMEDIEAVNAAMPDFAGFVFAPSKRQVSFIQAAALRAKLADGIIPVGVFVNEHPKLIQLLHHYGSIDIAQLHGEEDEEYIANLGVPCIKVFKDTKAQPTAAEMVLLDSGAGSGQTLDWRAVQAPDKLWFLAGGIDLSNIERAMRLRPFAVDVSSGAETNGKKDAEKILQLVRLAHNS